MLRDLVLRDADNRRLLSGILGDRVDEHGIVGAGILESGGAVVQRDVDVLRPLDALQRLGDGARAPAARHPIDFEDNAVHVWC